MGEIYGADRAVGNEECSSIGLSDFRIYAILCEEMEDSGF
jgi:hypothetical protein